MENGDLLNWARFYFSKGFPVIPLLPREKRPHPKLLKEVGWVKEDGTPTWELAKSQLTQRELHIWFSGKNPGNVGIGLVIPQNYVVIDIEKEEYFPLFFDATPDELAKATWVAKTGKGYHIYAKVDGGKPESVKLDGIIEIRTNGLMVVAPPSIHPSGRQYTWLRDPRVTEIGTLPWDRYQFFVKRVESAKRWWKLIEAIIPHWTPSKRHNLAGALAGFLRKQDVPKEEALFIIHIIARLSGDDEIGDRFRYVEDTYKKPIEEVQGLSGLKEILDEKVIEVIRELMGVQRVRELEERLRMKMETRVRELERQEEENLEEIRAQLQNEDLWSEIFRVMERFIKKDIRSAVYSHVAMISSVLPTPANLCSIAPSSEGKTYPIVTMAKIYPENRVTILVGATERSFIYDHSILVDENGNPIEEEVEILRELIATAKDRTEKKELEAKLRKLLRNAKRQVDLDGKILIFLEKPDSDLMKRMRPILSGDSDSFIYKFTDTSGNYIRTVDVLLKGWPVMIFCKAESESFDDWLEDQIKTRFLVISPQTGPEKYKEANKLTGDKMGLPAAAFKKIYNTDELDELKAKMRVVLDELERLKKQAGQGMSYIWNPFKEIITEKFPAEKGRHMRDIKNFIAIIHSVAATNVFTHPRLKYNGEENIIILPRDCEVALDFYESTLETVMAGVSENVIKFFKDLKKTFGTEEFTISNIVEKLGYRRGSAGDYLRKLLDLGVVDRRERDDRRGAYIWWITREEIVPPFAKELREAIRSFSKEDLARVLESIAQNEEVKFIAHTGEEITLDELWERYFARDLSEHQESMSEPSSEEKTEEEPLVAIAESKPDPLPLTDHESEPIEEDPLTNVYNRKYDYLRFKNPTPKMMKVKLGFIERALRGSTAYLNVATHPLEEGSHPSENPGLEEGKRGVGEHRLLLRCPVCGYELFSVEDVMNHLRFWAKEVHETKRKLDGRPLEREDITCAIKHKPYAALVTALEVWAEESPDSAEKLLWELGIPVTPESLDKILAKLWEFKKNGEIEGLQGWLEYARGLINRRKGGV